MTSANGYALTVKTCGGGTHELAAVWPAPYFVLSDNTSEPDQRPSLYHAASLEIAQRVAREWDGNNVILDALFLKV